MGLPNLDYDALPDDPYGAFFIIEEHVREDALAEIAGVDNSSRVIARYMQTVDRAASLYGISKIEYFDELTNTSLGWSDMFNAYANNIDDLKLEKNIQKRQMRNKETIRFDGKAKKKIHHYIERIKTLVEASELSPAKKEAIFSRLNALLNEVDKDRTKVQAVGELFIELSVIAREVGENLEPWLKFLNPLSHIMADAREDNTPQLESPPVPKRIESKTDTDSQ